MAEPKRAETSPDLEAPDRQGRVEALLVDGRDHYCSGRFEQAIHLWTRVLFLDRSHARARAYIDRARTALAEQHRRTDEMLHVGEELIARGDTDQARALLTRAVAASGDEARATALRWRLEHLERVRAGEAAGRSAAPAEGNATPAASRRGSRGLAWAASAIALLVLAAALGPGVRASLGFGPADPELSAASEPVDRPVLSSTEVALVRARTLYARGRLAEALQALDRVDSRSTSRAAADLLRVEIQDLLLQTGHGTAFDAQRSTGNQP